MAVGVVGGPQQLQALGVRMRALGAAGNIGPAAGVAFGGVTLRAQLLAGIRESAKPLIPKVREAAKADLPKRGGLAESVADSKFAVRTRLTGPRVGVRIVNTSKGGRGGNRGTIRHPLFGNTEKWYEQEVPIPGWFDMTLKDASPEVIPYIVSAMQAVAAEAAGRL